MENVKNENFVVIQGFMVKDLQLKGNELMIYAIIYGFSQLEGQCFNGSLRYLMDWTNLSKQGVLNCLNSLIDRGLIIKNENFEGVVKKVDYLSTNLTGVVKKVDGGGQKSLPRGSKNLTANNNIYIQTNHSDNTEDKIEDKKEDNIKAKKPKKEKYGEYNHVLLTDDEYNRLCNDYSQESVQKAIKFLDEYIEEKGYKSQSHNLSMRRWVFEAIGCVKGGKKSNNNQTLAQKNNDILNNVIATGELNNEYNRNGKNN